MVHWECWNEILDPHSDIFWKHFGFVQKNIRKLKEMKNQPLKYLNLLGSKHQLGAKIKLRTVRKENTGSNER